MKTINLQGKEYAPVSARVAEFHKDHADGSIKTVQTFGEGYVIFSATVSFGEREFTGHAFGKMGREKAFEKIETTAVGRALAFAGYLAGGEIASYDEVEAFYQADEALDLLDAAATLDDLKDIWASFSTEEKKDAKVLAKKEELKTKLQQDG